MTQLNDTAIIKLLNFQQEMEKPENKDVLTMYLKATKLNPPDPNNPPKNAQELIDYINQTMQTNSLGSEGAKT